MFKISCNLQCQVTRNIIIRLMNFVAGVLSGATAGNDLEKSISLMDAEVGGKFELFSGKMSI